MRRCFDLARLGAQGVSPNPMVGAVIVHGDAIIGEGFHQVRGKAHAEVNAFTSVSARDKDKIPDSTIYISLEPCSHQGLTPPCTNLILASGIRHVAISIIDPNPKIRGKGIEILEQNGISVTTGILEEEGNRLIANFSSAMSSHRPHVILKFVQSNDRYIGAPDHQVWLSNSFEKVLVHKMRGEIDGIMVGTNTVLVDNPRLTNREYFGTNPIRITFDRQRRIPAYFNILDGSTPTLIFTEDEQIRSSSESGKHGIPMGIRDSSEQEYHALRHRQASGKNQVQYASIKFDDNILSNCLTHLGKLNIQSVLVEGGARLINSFVKAGLWDQAWVVTTHHVLGKGVKAPLLHGHLAQTIILDSDEIQVINRI